MITLSRVLLGAKATLINRWKADHFVYLVLSILIIGIWLPRLRGPIDLRWDGAVYYILGTSIAEGKGYRLLNEPGEIQAIQYPPVLPLVVAAHQWVLGSSDPLIVGPWLRLSSFMIFFAYILISYAVLRYYLPLKVAFVGTVICLFHLQTYFMSDLLYPEVLYGLVTTSFVVINQRGHTQASTVIAVLLAIVAFGLRTIGVALLGAWVAESLLSRKYRSMGVRLFVAIVPVLCWQAYIASVVSGSAYSHPAYAYQRTTYMFYNVSYANNIFTLKDSFAPELGPASLRDLAKRIVLNFAQVPQALGEAVSSPRRNYETPWKLYELPFPFSTPWPVDVALVILGCLVVGGLGLHLTRRQWLLPGYVILSIASICLTPWPEQANRYLMPLTPFLVLFMMSAFLATASESWRWGTVGKAFGRLTVCLILLLQVMVLGFGYLWGYQQEVKYQDQQGRSIHYRLLFYRDAHRALDAGIDWLQVHAKPVEVLAGSMPHWMYLRTGLKAVMSPLEPDPVKAQSLLDSVPVTYLFLEEGLAVETKRYMIRVVQQFPEQWERVYTDTIAPDPGQSQGGEFAIYRRVGLPPSRSDASVMHSVSDQHHQPTLP